MVKLRLKVAAIISLGLAGVFAGKLVAAPLIGHAPMAQPQPVSASLERAH